MQQFYPALEEPTLPIAWHMTEAATWHPWVPAWKAFLVTSIVSSYYSLKCHKLLVSLHKFYTRMLIFPEVCFPTQTSG